jgi:hypothetical protein
VVPTTNLLFGSTLELLRKGKIDFEAENLHCLGDTYGWVRCLTMGIYPPFT